jgi:hypothetical protein
MARIEGQHRHPGDAQRIGDDRAVDRRDDRQSDAQQRRERLLDGRKNRAGAEAARWCRATISPWQEYNLGVCLRDP